MYGLRIILLVFCLCSTAAHYLKKYNDLPNNEFEDIKSLLQNLRKFKSAMRQDDESAVNLDGSSEEVDDPANEEDKLEKHTFNGGRLLDQENIDVDSTLGKMMEGMTVVENGREETPIGLHPEVDSKERENSLDQHRYISSEQSNEDGDTKRNFLENKSIYWTKGIVPYTLAGTLGQGQNKEIIENAIAELARKTCVRLVPKDSPLAQGLGHSSYIEFFSGSGCWSYVGRVFQSKQQISLRDPGCVYHSTVLHEIMHALGMKHEQSRTDRDENIKILTNNIKDGKVGNFNKGKTVDTRPYDAESVMQYNLYSFGKYINGKKQKTMEMIDKRLEFLTDKNSGLDFYDVAEITDAYQCAAKCTGTSRPLCQNGGYVDHNCTCFCPNGLKGDNCEIVDTSSDCGGIVDVSTTSTYLQTPGWPSFYPQGSKCTWLLRAPVGEVIKIQIEELSLPFNAVSKVCYHWLEIRYNLIGQLGPKRCGDIQQETWIASSSGNSNLMMLKFDAKFASDKSPKKGFKIKATTIGRGCADNPCRVGTCSSDSHGSYMCHCPTGVTGTHCEMVSASGSVTCDFEHGSSCFLKNDPQADVAWMQLNGRTPSTGTGPTGPAQGLFYWYAESSSPRKPGDIAVLVSNIGFSNDTPRCLLFMYSMYGKDVGTFNIYHEGQGVAKTAVFKKSGDKGQDWKFGEVTIQPATDLKIYIEAVRGGSWAGDIGIDDIQLVPGQCATTVPTASPSVEVECNFEDDDLQVCPFDLTMGTYDWTIRKGRTPSIATGPTEAFEGSYYAYLESSRRSQGSTAIMEYHVPDNKVDHRHCLSFAYHMYGYGTGSLTVDNYSLNGYTEEWRKDESQGNAWKTTEVPIQAGTSDIVITATRGKSWSSDIAVDHIVLKEGNCSYNILR